MTTHPPQNALNVVADAPDLRDRYYQPTLFPLKPELPPPVNLRILNQGDEGACTGFGLAATINLLFQFQRIPIRVSARMLYEMAKLYDEWPGEDYSGSSCRGAIKGWSNSGVCQDDLAPFYPGDNNFRITPAVSENARLQTLGAYYRLKPTISDFHSALAEAGVIYVSASIHKGWRKPKKDGSGLCSIPENLDLIGGHAFAIIGYNDRGFWVQNSWSEEWGDNGIALWVYTDWAKNLLDAWVVQVALPTPQVFQFRPVSGTINHANQATFNRSVSRQEIEHHFVHIDDGSYHSRGRYWSNSNQIEVIESNIKKENPDHLLIYAHGGLNSTNSSAKRIAAMKDTFLGNGVYPIHFMYDTGLLEELKDIILSKRDRTELIAGGFWDWWNHRIENATRKVGRALWREMKYGARSPFSRASSDGSDAISRILEAAESLGKEVKVHVVGHSTGAILHAHLLKQLYEQRPDIKIETCSLLAPAATNALYESNYLPLLSNGFIKETSIYNLTDVQEQNDSVAGVYRKSLLYLVSRAFEEEPAEPLLGMQRYNQDLSSSKISIHFIYSGQSKKSRCSSTSHGGFDNDPDTMNDVLRRVLRKKPKTYFTRKVLNNF